MANSWSLQEVCTLLDIDFNTLKRWLDRAGIEPVVDPVDLRRRTITLDEVYHLSVQHGRAVQLPGGVPGALPKPGNSPELLKRIEELEKRVARLEEGYPVQQSKQVVRVTQEQPKQEKTPTRLPDGLVAVSSYAQDHGIAVSTVKGAIERRELPAVAGNWKVGRTHVTLALSQEGQKVFHQMYERWGTFQVRLECPYCVLLIKGDSLDV